MAVKVTHQQHHGGCRLLRATLPYGMGVAESRPLRPVPYSRRCCGRCARVLPGGTFPSYLGALVLIQYPVNVRVPADQCETSHTYDCFART
jgi:hypothetical protein